MIITRLAGRLGNQMFQYAIGKALAERNGVELKLDLFSFTEPPYGPYTLNRFNIVENVATEKEVAWFKKYKWRKGRFWFWYNRLIANRARYVDERQFNFEPWVAALKDPVYLEGYWNTEKYFKNIEPLLRKEFTLKSHLSEHSVSLEKEIDRTQAVSLHVRRADMVTVKSTDDWHGVCSIEYYNQAIKMIAERVSDPHFFIFSDDPVWAKENITPPFPTIYITGNDGRPEEDLYLMSQCKHHIIANSTFSWWGAWLNPHQDKIVIAPKKWFNTAKMDTRDITPETWIKI